MFRIQKLLWLVTPLVLLAALTVTMLGGGVELAAMHGVLHVASTTTQSTNEPIPFYG